MEGPEEERKKERKKKNRKRNTKYFFPLTFGVTATATLKLTEGLNPPRAGSKDTTGVIHPPQG